MMRTPLLTRVVGLAMIVTAGASCGDVSRSGRSPMYLVIDGLDGSRGKASPGPFTVPLISDVITNVISPPAPCSSTTPCTTFNDNGQVVIRSVFKDVTSAAALAPTSNNDVMITQYRVVYRRSDRPNAVQGVDVPYAFDGGMTGSITAHSSARTFTFELVRSIAKMQTPLVELQNNPGVIEMIADVTFYGHDLAGNELNVTGSITIEFGNFGD